MAEKILLINPIRARKGARINSRRVKPANKRSAAKMAKRKTRRTAAQKRATAKLVAFNRAKRRSPAKRKSNPISSRAAAYRGVATMSNPIRRRRKKAVGYTVGSGPIRRRKLNPIRRRRSRNPIGGGLLSIVSPAITAASGALALDLAWGYLPLPANIKAGPLRHVAKAAGAIALSMIAGKVVKKSTADAMGVGALTVVIHEAAKEAIHKFVPGVKMDGVGLYVQGLGGLGYYSAGMPAGGALPDNSGMGLYVNGYSGSGLETEAGYTYD
jgi:hypothetical protein